MKILQITDGLPPETLGGSGQITWETAVGLTKEGHEVVVLTTGNAPSTEIREGIEVRSIRRLPTRWAHWRSVFSHRRAAEILKHIEDIKPDLIHAHAIAWQTGYRWIRMADKRGFPIVITAHDVMHVAYGRVRPGEQNLALRDFLRFRWSYNPLRNHIIRSILNNHALTLCVSDALRELMEKKGFTNLRTVHNGIDLDFWKKEMMEHARSAMNLPKDVPLFFLAGRLGVDKGIGIVNRTLPKGAHLVVAGNQGPDLFDVPKDRLHFFPHQSRESMHHLYNSCDAVLVPSLCLDCFPTVCLEAMACSKPVLASDWGGAKEAIIAGHTGWIIDPLQEADWRSRMQWCIDHRGELHSFGEAGRMRMEERFSLKIYIHSLLAIYEFALS